MSPTIVFVHGAWHGSWCWANVVDHLEAEGFATVAVDLPDHETPGSSARIWKLIGDYVDHVHSVLDGIDGDIVLVGHSMGGLVTQRVLESRRVALGILVASSPLRGVVGAVLRLLRRDPKQVLEATASLSLWPMVANDRRAAEHFFAPDCNPAVLADALPKLQSESYPAFLSMMTRLPKPDRVASPISVIASRQDTIFTLDEQRRLAVAYNAPMKVLDCGHDLMLDTCWPDLAAEITVQVRALK